MNQHASQHQGTRFSFSSLGSQGAGDFLLMSLDGTGNPSHGRVIVGLGTSQEQVDPCCSPPIGTWDLLADQNTADRLRIVWWDGSPRARRNGPGTSCGDGEAEHGGNAMTLRKAIALIALLLVGLFVLAGVTSATYQGFPTLNPTAPPDPAEVAAIKAVIDRAYDLDGLAARTFDVSQFPTVYANDPSVQVNGVQAGVVAKARGVQAAAAAGYLDYKLAFYGRWQAGAEQLEQLQAAARAQGRQMTAAELRSVAVDGQPPPPRRTDPMYKTGLRFDNFTIDGSRAEVVFDDGAVLQRAFLLKTATGWKIVGQRPIKIHA
jgi:hypothetical protein